MILLVSDLLTTEDLEDGLSILAKRGFDVGVIHLLAKDEIEPTIGGELEILDSETGEIVEVTIGPEAIAMYKQRLAAWLHNVEQQCLRLGIRYVAGDTSIPLEVLMMYSMRRRGLIG